MRMITCQQLSAALLCTERNIRQREGSSLPQSVAGADPRAYVLAEVLWAVDGRDRVLICRACGLDAAELQTEFSRLLLATGGLPASASAGYVPGEDDE